LGKRMRRRQFLTLLGSIAIGWPAEVVAQKPNPVRRIGVLMGFAAGDAAGLGRARTFTQALQDLGWTDGQNARIDYRWPDGDIEQIQALAKELVGSRPDVLVGAGTAQAVALRQATRTIPIVFVMSGDPVDQGVVEGLARPSGNATGFFAFEPAAGGKLLELLKEIVPGLRRVAVIFNPETAPSGTSYLHSVEAATALFSVEVTGAPVHRAGDIELAISPLAREPGGGLIVLPDAFTVSHRKQFIELAAQYRLPAIYGTRDFAYEGGLLTYGTNPLELYRRAGSYVDQILKGANPANLPVQASTVGLVINLKTAKALGLTVPPSLLVSADEVIE
jgi:putative tryptophan/tyrosine transport system substrate-binding protein